MGDWLYLNFFAVSTLIPLLFLTLAVLYLACIPGKSRSTRALAMHFSSIALYYVFVFLKSSVLDERMAYLRFLEAWPILLSYPLFLHFAGGFPADQSSRLTKYLAIPTIVVAIAVGVYGNIGAMIAEPVYRYDGQYWDLEMDGIGKVVAIFLLLMVCIVYFFLVWRVVHVQGRERSGMFGITVGMVGASLVPFITNILMYDGRIGREIHQLVVNLSVMLGFFAIFIVYINFTTDRTSLLARIVGISVAVFFVVMQLVAFMTLGDRELSFDRDHDARSRLYLRGGERPANLRYIIYYSSTGNPANIWKDPQHFTNNSRNLRGMHAAVESGLPGQLRTAPNQVRRMYRTAIDGFAAGDYIAYLIPDPTGGFAEVGFDYTAYRRFIHAGASKLVYMLLGVILFFLIGFRVFFYGTLIAPLSRLLDGVRSVNQGDLDARLPVKIEDEIGYLSHSFNAMLESIRRGKVQLIAHAEELEDRVRARTHDLENSLTEIQSLKNQQDGDYYLTSQLLKPLGQNRVSENGVRVDFLLRQKKTFQFRQWKAEIGGDLNKSQVIFLNDRKYATILNSDAMGKSIQGAGGALVLGAVFESIIQRTINSPATHKVKPEVWLKRAFTEIQAVFASFDGSMMVSMILALIDTKSGELLFINAEHPFLVLYRDGVASFVDREIFIHKPGSPRLGDSEERVVIHRRQLLPGDVIISGSDGRDDLLLSLDAVGDVSTYKFGPETLIEDAGVRNEDETAFLRRVEEGEGDLDRIYDAICEKGTITDDLSLVRLAFQPD